MPNHFHPVLWPVNGGVWRICGCIRVAGGPSSFLLNTKKLAQRISTLEKT
jgi:hypothetical protein